jgi:hypothetical protein
VPESLPSDLLLELYKIAVEEYRFEVRLNWDRTAYYLTLNSSLITIAAGLLKIGGAPIVNFVVAGVFSIGLLSSFIGIRNILGGHEYYRRTVVKKTLLEEQIGLNKPVEGHSTGLTLAVGTTVGQNEHLQILHDTEKWLKRFPRLSSVTTGGLAHLRFFTPAPPQLRLPHLSRFSKGAHPNCRHDGNLFRRDRRFPKSQSPKHRSGFRDTKRRLPNNYL